MGVGRRMLTDGSSAECPTRDVKTGGERGGATGTLVNEHIGNAALQRESEGGDFTGNEGGV